MRAYLRGSWCYLMEWIDFQDGNVLEKGPLNDGFNPIWTELIPEEIL